MKFILNLFLLLITFIVLENKAYSLSDYKIKKICKKARNELVCIKNLKERRANLEKGNKIEIPVIPYKDN